MTAQERPAGRPAFGARPAGALDNRTKAARAEFQRLVDVGVSRAAAAVLVSTRPRVQPAEDDERAYWRQIARGRRATPQQCAAHAAAQRARRHLDTSRRSA